MLGPDQTARLRIFGSLPGGPVRTQYRSVLVDIKPKSNSSELLQPVAKQLRAALERARCRLLPQVSRTLLGASADLLHFFLLFVLVFMGFVVIGVAPLPRARVRARACGCARGCRSLA